MMLLRMSSCLRVSLNLSTCLNLQTLSSSTSSSSSSSSSSSLPFFRITTTSPKSNHRPLLQGMPTPSSPHRASYQSSSSSSSSSSSISSSGSVSAGGDDDDVRREILVQHLLVKQEDVNLLLDLQQRIARGEDLSDLAAEYSICPSKQDGGMLGWVSKGQMVPEFEETAFSASLNKVVKCKTKFGWHLLQVLSEREKSVLENIQCKELHMKIQDPSFLDEAQLIDVREPEEVAQASLTGFQVLPLRQFGSWGPDITTKFDPQKDTYVMCHHGMRSLQVAQWLQTQGFKRVFNVAGGIHEYAQTVDQTIPTY